MSDTHDIQELFFTGARTVIEAIADPAVEAAWDQPSVLEEQLVGSVAGHLARSGIWVVVDYLEAGTPTGEPDFENASAYFAAVAVGASPEVKRAIRDRGAGVAALGRAEVLHRCQEDLGRLETKLRPLPRRSFDDRLRGEGNKAVGLPEHSRRGTGSTPRRLGAQRWPGTVAATKRAPRRDDLRGHRYCLSGPWAGRHGQSAVPTRVRRKRLPGALAARPENRSQLERPAIPSPSNFAPSTSSTTNMMTALWSDMNSLMAPRGPSALVAASM